MPRLSVFVKNSIVRDQTLLYLLRKGIINLSALADSMKEDAEAFMGEPVNKGALFMNIKRAVQDLEKDDSKQPISVNSIDYEVVMTSSIFAINIKSEGEVTRDILNRFNRIVSGTDNFLNITESGDEISIVTSEKNRVLCEEMFRKAQVLSKISNLSCIVVTFRSSGFIETEGILYRAFKRLYYENINVYEIYSTHNKMAFVISHENAHRAYDVLNKFLA